MTALRDIGQDRGLGMGSWEPSCNSWRPRLPSTRNREAPNLWYWFPSNPNR